MEVEIENRQITIEARSTLMSWILDVHKSFEFRQDTFFTCVHIIDSFTSRCNVRISEYQLVGLTALFIAGKYEEIQTPSIKQFVVITDRLFESNDILMMEGKILCELSFRILRPNIKWFIDCFLDMLNCNKSEEQ